MIIRYLFNIQFLKVQLKQEMEHVRQDAIARVLTAQQEASASVNSARQDASDSILKAHQELVELKQQAITAQAEQFNLVEELDAVRAEILQLKSSQANVGQLNQVT